MMTKLISFVSVLSVLSLLMRGLGQTPVAKLNAPLSCVDSLSVSDTLLQSLISKYVRQAESYELPIIAVRQRHDTTFYYVSALIATNSIRRNPPSGISRQFGREALLYTDRKSTKLVGAECQTYLLTKYVKVLHVDKVNTKYNLPVGTPRGILHDPLLIKIIKTSDRITLARADRFPDFDYSGI